MKHKSGRVVRAGSDAFTHGGAEELVVLKVLCLDMVGKGCVTISGMIGAVRWSVTALFVAQILVDSGLGYPMSLVEGKSNFRFQTHGSKFML